MFTQKDADQSGVLCRQIYFFFFFLPFHKKTMMCFSKHFLLIFPQNSSWLGRDSSSNQVNLVEPTACHFLEKVTGANFLRGIIFIQSLDRYSWGKRNMSFDPNAVPLLSPKPQKHQNKSKKTMRKNCVISSMLLSKQLTTSPINYIILT